MDSQCTESTSFKDSSNENLEQDTTNENESFKDSSNEYLEQDTTNENESSSGNNR